MKKWRVMRSDCVYIQVRVIVSIALLWSCYFLPRDRSLSLMAAKCASASYHDYFWNAHGILTLYQSGCDKMKDVVTDVLTAFAL